MNLLIDNVPDSLNGVPISTDYRAMVQLEQLIFDREIPATAKIHMGLALLFPAGYAPMSVQEAWNALLWYYRCGKDDPEPETEEAHPPRPGRPAAPKRSKRVYDFEQDADHIYAAFRQVYCLDLQSEALHWWEFCAMLYALPDSCLQGKIMAYRATDASKLKGAEKRRVQRIQRAFAIKDSALNDVRSLAERDQQIKDAVTRRFEEAKKWKERQQTAGKG